MYLSNEIFHLKKNKWSIYILLKKRRELIDNVIGGHSIRLNGLVSGRIVGKVVNNSFFQGITLDDLLHVPDQALLHDQLPEFQSSLMFLLHVIPQGPLPTHVNGNIAAPLPNTASPRSSSPSISNKSQL